MSWFSRPKPSYCNQLAAAWDEYNSLAQVVRDAGMGYLANQYAPCSTASLEEIQQATSDLRQVYGVRIGVNPYVSPMD